MTGLQAERLNRYLTVQELAKQSDVPERTIYRIEEGRGARVETLKKLAKCLDVPASSLLRGAPEFSGANAVGSDPERKAA